MNPLTTTAAPAKGDINGTCYRTSCQSPGATFYNHSTRKYYCTNCADLINRANHEDAIRLFGHALCTDRLLEMPVTKLSKEQMKAKRLALKDKMAALHREYCRATGELEEQCRQLEKAYGTFAPFQPQNVVRVHQQLKKTAKSTDCIVLSASMAVLTDKYEFSYDLRKLDNSGPMVLRNVTKIELITDPVAAGLCP
ncbi:hypothetical protein [Spirosoma sp.]|uniref:hypothetical protein n=1 Tax=Spirosoma sp. TaxID=1899569 RepID=UPI002637A7D9|nr:hypothetical protein [Spirosoma sp.]MCX6217576.1 hypothetical protein [Spirosoma sp.]